MPVAVTYPGVYVQPLENGVPSVADGGAQDAAAIVAADERPKAVEAPLSAATPQEMTSDSQGSVALEKPEMK